jgi:aspartyl-tRNA(Asn)/glutamyl-tRNA(Gln) amidotransferase subunit B
MNNSNLTINEENYEAVIGIEVHVQLSTSTKIFCSCPNQPGAEPNSTICEICTGQPGTLPLLNEKVVEYATMTALATQSHINTTSEFSRKHYFYPDLPKGFQITQADIPIAEYGKIIIRLDDGSTKTVRIRRIHIEEDAGKSLHAHDNSCSLVDLNRAGTPLLEIVTEPDLNSPAEVRAYLQELHAIVTALGISSGNMEEGAFRADTNISVRPRGSTQLGTRCELKNINSFKFIADATQYEISRQISLLAEGKSVIQQTRLWDTKQKITIPMRSKEEAADYRYMPEPDIPLLKLDAAHIDHIRTHLPELPAQRMQRLMNDYGLSDYEAGIIAYDAPLARYFEAAWKIHPSKTIVHWLLRNVLATLKEHGWNIAQCLVETSPLRPQQLAELVSAIDKGTINARTAQEIFDIMLETNETPHHIIKERGLEQIGSSEELEHIIAGLVQQHAQQAQEYRAGKTKLWGFFIGKAMEQTKGRAQPQVLNELLKKHLS